MNDSEKGRIAKDRTLHFLNLLKLVLRVMQQFLFIYKCKESYSFTVVFLSPTPSKAFKF